MCEELREASASQLFTGSPMPGALLTSTWRIVAVNDAYLAATGRERGDLVGRPLWEVLLPPSEPEADGEALLTESLETVLAQGRHDAIPGLTVAGASGDTATRTWSVLNSPLVDAHGAVVGVLHQIQDPRPAEGTKCAGAGDADTDRGAECLRVGEALAAIAGAQGSNRSPEAQRARRRLWRRIIADYRESGSYDWLAAACRQADRIGEQTTGAAVSSYGPDGLPKVLAASDEWSQTIEQIQEMTGEGPAISARATRLPVLVPDLRREKRWPVFAVLAGQAGATSLWVGPVTIRDATVATISVFGSRPTPWRRGDLAQVALLADLVGTALIADLARLEDDADVGVRLDRPADPSAMAAGMLSAQWGIPVAEASLRLRALAFSRGEALEVTALGVLAGTIRPE